MCVEHLKRCKTSTAILPSCSGFAVSFHFFTIFDTHCPILIFTAVGDRRPIELWPTKLSMVPLGYPG